MAIIALPPIRIADSLFGYSAQPRLKVLFVSHTSNLAGAERSLLGLIAQLKKRGVECEVIIPHSGLMEQELNRLSVGYKIIPFEWWAQATKISSARLSKIAQKNNLAVLEIASEIRKFNPDIVYTNTIVIPWGAIAARLTNKIHVWSIREFGRINGQGFNFNLGYIPSLRVIDQLSDAVFVNSKAVKKEVCKIIKPSKVFLYYNYITINPRLKTVKSSLPGKTNLLIAGSIMPTKGQADALKALKYLDNSNLNLTIMGSVGDKVYFKKMIKFIKDNQLDGQVKILNFTVDPYSIMKGSDIVLVCSKNEAWGRVVTEARLLKKVVIGTKSGGIIEQIRDGKNGILYKPGDPKQLAQKIKYLISKPERMKKIALNGYKYAIENISEEKCIDSLFAHLLKLKDSKSHYLWPLKPISL